jgi:hypothetical protein
MSYFESRKFKIAFNLSLSINIKRINTVRKLQFLKRINTDLSILSILENNKIFQIPIILIRNLNRVSQFQLILSKFRRNMIVFILDKFIILIGFPSSSLINTILMINSVIF